MVAIRQKKRLEAKCVSFDNSLELTLPIITVSEANNFEHWTKKARRHRLQQRTVAILLRPQLSKIKLPCSIQLIRFASRKLDKHDNLPMSCKYITDAVCALITNDKRPGRADDDERILNITFGQETPSPYGVKVIVSW